MKQYKNNLEKEEEQALQSTIQKHQVENFIQENKEEVPNQEYQKSYRLNQIREKKQNSIKQQLDALSTATSNFYKESNENQIKDQQTIVQFYKKMDQSQINLIKQQRVANRIISAKPLKHLVIKKGQESSQFQQFESHEQKRSLLIFQGQGDKQLQQQDEEMISVNQQISQDQHSQIFKRPSRLRKISQSNGAYLAQTSQQQEPQIESQLLESSKEQIIGNQSQKSNKDELYDSLEIETIQNISKMKESQFDSITKIEFRFNAKEGSLYMLGELLTNLQELTLDNSNIESLRLLGTKLTFLQILSIRKSNLVDLSGILSMPNLVELNCSFNSINDVSPLAFHSRIASLDLEGNLLTDEYQLGHLESLNLQNLNLKKNPICCNQKLYEIICHRFAEIKLEIDSNSKITENPTDEQKQTSKIQSQEQKINQEEQKIKQLQTLIDDLEQNKSLCQSLKGKQQEKHKLRRPQTAQAQQVKPASPLQSQKPDYYDLLIDENCKDPNKKSKQIYSLKKPIF
ncbi:unnamed protein product (macronuclear) [Paramecium tetraurelia]|uniref:Uncharacterized protein n=1 Tax=Paramecium tetraurelia TaxID=5888 RepID=A0CJG9_PARTE|nr:uncharacterized protein GSPATT00000647001 [Paramecium tetraurelia]CAK70936.1 unnamed protein product [Paramecium tetraurelia]|eukprot:XP_001438333.1 hypothetical protein (macronuclear) [Paramecium tetraurelia strain d4-2]